MTGEPFDPVAIGAGIAERALVRLPLMRSTIHLVTAEVALALCTLTQVPIERSTLGVFGRRLAGVDREALVGTARALVEEEPLIASELGHRLAQRFPGHDPEALA